jgi:hypothetical protein
LSFPLVFRNDCTGPDNRSYVLNLNLSKQNIKTIPPEIGQLNKADQSYANIFLISPFTRMNDFVGRDLQPEWQ